VPAATAAGTTLSLTAARRAPGCTGAASTYPYTALSRPPVCRGPMGKWGRGPASFLIRSQMSMVKKKGQELQVFLDALAKPVGGRVPAQ